MRSRFFKAQNPQGEHSIHYTEWGELGAPVVLCVHGLTQTARSFDALAVALSTTHRVICPDVVGRGKSDWLPDPMHYGFPQYVSDMISLMAHLDVAEFDLVGTSMGGIIGMFLAVQNGTLLQRLVLNDVGPFVPRTAVERIRDYVGTDPNFPDLKAFESYLREIWAPFGDLTDTQWRHLAETSHRVTGTGLIAPAYDPDIRLPLVAAPVADADLWSFWDMISLPTLVLRGALSDLLLPDVAAAMTKRGPNAILLEFEGVGHAPALMARDQIKSISGFLQA